MANKSVNVTALTVSKTHDDGSQNDFTAKLDAFNDGEKTISVEEGGDLIYIPLDVWPLLRDKIDALAETENQLRKTDSEKDHKN